MIKVLLVHISLFLFLQSSLVVYSEIGTVDPEDIEFIGWQPTNLKIISSANGMKLTWAPPKSHYEKSGKEMTYIKINPNEIDGYYIYLNEKFVAQRSVKANSNSNDFLSYTFKNLRYGSHKIQVQTYTDHDYFKTFSVKSNPVYTPKTVHVLNSSISINGNNLFDGRYLYSVKIGGQLMASHIRLFKALGFSVKSDSQNKTIIAKSKDSMYTIYLKQDSKILKVTTKNSVKTITMPSSPTVMNGVIMVPIRSIVTEIGYDLTVN